jgi:hypothetical protein
MFWLVKKESKNSRYQDEKKIMFGLLIKPVKYTTQFEVIEQKIANT